VRFDKLRLRERLPQTATANDVTIVPDTVSFVYEGFGGKKTTRRTQLPLTPCQSMTVPMVQGKTLGHFWVDLNVDDSPGHKMTCLYVMISRATDLGNVRLLQPFHHGQLHRSRDSAIRNEELRLLQIESSTLQHFIRSHPDLAAGVFADVAHSHAAQSQPTQTAKQARERSADDLGVCVFVCVCVCAESVCMRVTSISHCFSCTQMLTGRTNGNVQRQMQHRAHAKALESANRRLPTRTNDHHAVHADSANAMQLVAFSIHTLTAL
jgi:hypothetical protein